MTRNAHLRTFDADTLAKRLRDIDARLYETPGTLTVNQPDHKPRKNGFVPSRSRRDDR